MSNPWTKLAGSWRSGDRVLIPIDPVTTLSPGAVLPILDPLPVPLPGQDFIYVNPALGSDTAGGSITAPLKTLKRALIQAGAGDIIVLRGGTYSIPDNLGSTIASGKNDLEIRAFPGEVPTFDGSVAAPAVVANEGDLRYFPYTQMPAMPGEGVGLASMPAATFTTTPPTAGSAPTGLAAERGFVRVSGTSYSIPNPQTYASPGSDTYNVITGHYPDQVWADGKALIQVQLKSLVKKGCFYVDGRASATDLQSRATNLYLHKDDLGTTGTDSSKVQVSAQGQHDYLLVIYGHRAKIRGIRIFGMSQANGYMSVQINTGIDGVLFQDCEWDSCSGINLKLYGVAGTAFDGSGIIADTMLSRCTFTRCGWQAISASYTDDFSILDSKFEYINWHSEFASSPQSGALKARASQRLIVNRCSLVRLKGHGLWLDQSNYDCTIVNSYFDDINGSPVFWEISHKLLLIGNLIVKRTGSGFAVRISGASGAVLVGNTVVGGDNVMGIVADPRGKTFGGRYLSEHTERYGTGSYGADSGGHPASDLDKARPGAFAPPKPDMTPGMNWLAGAAYIANNVFANPVSGYPVYAQGTASGTFVEARDLLPPTTAGDSFHRMDGNIYQSSSGYTGRIVADPGHGTTVAAGSLAAWRTALQQTYYQAALNDTTIESVAREGIGWVTPAGRPTPAFEALRGTGIVIDTGITGWSGGTDLNDLIAVFRNLGSGTIGAIITPPGGWA